MLTVRPSAIQSLDLQAYRDRLIDAKGKHQWNPDRAERAIQGYRDFLAVRQERSASPSKDVDEVWHLHILDTMKYVLDCQDVFGRYLHHTPSGSTCE